MQDELRLTRIRIGPTFGKIAGSCGCCCSHGVSLLLSAGIPAFSPRSLVAGTAAYGLSPLRCWRQRSYDWRVWARASIVSIIRALTAAAILSALLWVLFQAVGLREIAVPFLLATTIEAGLIVIAVAWRLLTRAHPDSS